ncbi:MAG: hypothetical protein HYZ34_04920 [Ignavibacteriae bacterium]|nr:hypothetical protein [Ignavibacteriota bacterium]
MYTNVIKNYSLLIVSIIVFLSLTYGQAQETRFGIWKNQEIEYVDQEINVILQRNVRFSDAQPLLESLPINIVNHFDKIGCGTLRASAGVNIFSLMELLERSPFIKAAEPNQVTHVNGVPNDYYFTKQWGMNNTGQNPPSGTVDADIDAPEAWDITTGNSSIILAVLDSGIPLDGEGVILTHPDLDDVNKFIVGPNYSTNLSHCLGNINNTGSSRNSVGKIIRV